MRVVDATTVRAMDAVAIANGTPGEVLMRRAGVGVAEQIRDLLATRYAGHCDRIVILAGRGNNGGDGFVIAAELAELLPVVVFSPCPRTAFSGDARIWAERLPDTVTWRHGEALPNALLQPNTLIVDAMLGTGAVGPLRAPFDSWVAQVNAASGPVVAVDLPSGLDASSGLVASDAVNADATITIGAPKTGLYQNQGGKRAGIIRFVDIGLELPETAEAAFHTTTAAEIVADRPPLSPDRHKGTMGRVVIIGGCRDYRGAPILSARAALRSGAGLVTAVVPSGARVSATPAAIMTLPLGHDSQVTHRQIDDPRLTAVLDAADVLVLGPGLGRTPPALAFLKPIVSRDTPKVIDADGLLTIDSDFEAKGPTIITPHPGEFSSLAERLQLELPGDRIANAQVMAQALGVIVVLKGQRTVVAGPDARVNVCGRGCAALASGGSGDVLAGVIGASLARCPGQPFEAACHSVWIHAAASESIPHGTSGLIADDLPAAIADQVRNLDPIR